MIKINLIGESKRPAAVRKRKPLAASVNRENAASLLLLVGVIFGVVLLGLEYWVLHNTLDNRKEEAAVLQKEYEVLKPIIDEVNAFEAKNAELERKIEVIQNLKLSQIGPVRVMDHVSRALPELVWLSRMDVSRNNIRLVGSATNENAVANFIENLDRVEEFQEPSLNHMRESRGGLTTAGVTGALPSSQRS
ncbi:MAG: PilN domain-containing protein [Acidobacteriota bacterium]|nr:PilN domain-containing protein [Acidobacteriota bacterium]